MTKAVNFVHQEDSQNYYDFEPRKEVVTLSLDSDVLAVLRTYGSDFQKKANEALRDAFLC